MLIHNTEKHLQKILLIKDSKKLQLKIDTVENSIFDHFFLKYYCL